MEEMITREQMEKLKKLQDYLRSLESVAVAFSSGVDSTFLLKVAKDTLGDKVMAVTAQSCSFPKRELKEAIAFCEKEGIKHVICESEELSIEGFAQNPKNRCYLCKKELFEKIQKIAADNGMKAIVEGSNLDDNGDYRPGLQAVAELGIKSPLRHCDLTKADIRALSHYLHLPTWEKQSFACLSSRFVYGETITAGSTALRIISLGFIVSSVSITSSGALEGLGKGIPSLMISLCRYAILILPLAFLLSRLIGPSGVWHAFWICEAITAGISYAIYRQSSI